MARALAALALAACAAVAQVREEAWRGRRWRQFGAIGGPRSRRGATSPSPFRPRGAKKRLANLPSPHPSQSQSDTAFAAYDRFAAASRPGKPLPGAAADPRFVRAAVASALPQLAPGAPAVVTAATGVPGVVEQAVAVPNKPLAGAPAAPPAPAVADGIFYQAVDKAVDGPVLAAVAPPPAARPASAVAATRAQTAGGAPQRTVALPPLDEAAGEKIDRVLDGLLERLDSPNTATALKSAAAAATAAAAGAAPADDPVEGGFLGLPRGGGKGAGRRLLQAPGLGGREPGLGGREPGLGGREPGPHAVLVQSATDTAPDAAAPHLGGREPAAAASTPPHLGGREPHSGHVPPIGHAPPLAAVDAAPGAGEKNPPRARGPPELAAASLAAPETASLPALAPTVAPGARRHGGGVGAASARPAPSGHLPPLGGVAVEP